MIELTTLLYFGGSVLTAYISRMFWTTDQGDSHNNDRITSIIFGCVSVALFLGFLIQVGVVTVS